jgi:GNAT superfamily N-acetyltransferase
MTTTIMLKPATARDVDILLSLVGRYYAFDQVAFDADDIRAGLFALLQDDGLGRVWFIHYDGSLAGYAVLTFGYDHEIGGRTGTLTDLYIEEAFRNQGLGTQTMVFIEAEARRLDLGAIELQALTSNLVAQKLYRKMGYTAFDRIPMVKRL